MYAYLYHVYGVHPTNNNYILDVSGRLWFLLSFASGLVGCKTYEAPCKHLERSSTACRIWNVSCLRLIPAGVYMISGACWNTQGNLVSVSHTTTKILMDSLGDHNDSRWESGTCIPVLYLYLCHNVSQAETRSPAINIRRPNIPPLHCLQAVIMHSCRCIPIDALRIAHQQPVHGDSRITHVAVSKRQFNPIRFRNGNVFMKGILKPCTITLPSIPIYTTPLSLP